MHGCISGEMKLNIIERSALGRKETIFFSSSSGRKKGYHAYKGRSDIKMPESPRMKGRVLMRGGRGGRK